MRPGREDRHRGTSPQKQNTGRICNTNLCPAGIATQKPELRKLLDVDHAAQRLANFLGASIDLMQIMARACAHTHLNQFHADDLSAWKKEMADLSGVTYSGIGARQ